MCLHRTVDTALIPPVPVLVAQGAAMGGFGLVTITSAPLEKIQLGLPWPVLEHSWSQPQALQGFLCLALLPAHPPPRCLQRGCIQPGSFSWVLRLSG